MSQNHLPPPPFFTQDDQELEHFGIKGMRWGVRRYQPSYSPGPKKDMYCEKKKKVSRSVKVGSSKSSSRKEKVIKAAKIAGLAGLGAVSIAAMATPTGARLVRDGATAVSSILNISRGMSYRNLQSIDAQKIQQQLQGVVDELGYRNLQSMAAQKIQQQLRR